MQEGENIILKTGKVIFGIDEAWKGDIVMYNSLFQILKQLRVVFAYH